MAPSEEASTKQLLPTYALLLMALAGSGWLPVEAATIEALLAERFLDEVLRCSGLMSDFKT